MGLLYPRIMKTRRSATPLVLLAIGLAGSSPVAPPATGEPRVATIAQEYSGYRRITPRPVRVNPALSTMCASVAPANFEEQMVGKFGPHANTALKIFMNE